MEGLSLNLPLKRSHLQLSEVIGTFIEEQQGGVVTLSDKVSSLRNLCLEDVPVTPENASKRHARRLLSMDAAFLRFLDAPKLEPWIPDLAETLRDIGRFHLE